MQEDTTPPASGTTASFFDRVRAETATRVRRDTDRKWIGGVCSGVAEALGIDPIIVRVVVVLLAVLPGIGVLAYLLAWLFLPTREGRILAEEAVVRADAWAIVLIAVTATAVTSLFWWDNHTWPGPLPGMLIVGGLLWWIFFHDNGAQRFFDGRGSAQAPTPPAVPEGGAPVAGQAPPPPAGTVLGAGAPQAGTVLGAGAPPAGPGHPYGSGYGFGPSGPRPTPPSRPRRRSLGFLGGVVTAGLALVAYGVTMLVAREQSWDANHELLALAAALATFGVVLLASGLRGRRGGFASFLATILAIVTAISAALGATLLRDGVGDQTWRPTTVESRQYELGAGEATLDLTAYPADPDRVVDIDATIALGELRIIVPADLTVTIDSRIRGGGMVMHNGDGVDEERWSFDGNRTSGLVQDSRTIGSGATELRVNADLRFGQLTIVKEQ
ncbi:PspC domain-containing protein [Janibacter sp. G56]|uniref:PspC domain-containing protein n=1 Tax=Janibacter sp. G56 TaxID=3418717 RepID=UPI003D092122